jgi:hypothetical protein
MSHTCRAIHQIHVGMLLRTNPRRITSVSSKLKECSFQYKILPRSVPNSERKIIALLLFLNFNAFTPCVAPERQGESQEEIRLGALRVANRKHMNSVALSAMAGSHRESISVLLEKLLRIFSP